ncbi:uncharacterized protein [Halyomorpha halys]|uniref:uncharacterized protein n=1 Tax=Halyomorpha halys TaxID=286706 RepID=UPI0006D4F025|nr:uncharacterized protein LOC106679226 [Halyomorpha halys]
MEKIWLFFLMSTTTFTLTEMASVDIISDDPETNDTPSVFVLEPDPGKRFICYTGKSLNINTNSHNELEISSIKEATTNNTDSSAKNTKKFVLSSDPQSPVICKEVYIPPHSMNNGSAEEEKDTASNITCIRRDYGHDISAIFINEIGPIQSAWNIFNRTMAYGFYNVKNIDSIGEIRMLNETIVDCEEYRIKNAENDPSIDIAALIGAG